MPFIDRTLITRLVKVVDDRSLIGSWAEIMNCSFSTNCTMSLCTKRTGLPVNTYQNTNDRIVVRIVDIVREIFDDVEETLDEVVVHEYYHLVNYHLPPP